VRKFVLCFCFVLLSAAAFCQKKSIVLLIKSESSTGIKTNGRDIVKVYKGTFKQDFSLLSSDSAYFYPKENAFDAFGHVNINQGDTLNIYSDLLNYNGNTKIAILTNNVKMIDKDATLTTNHLVYNTATRIGTYTDGGKLVNKDNTLLSKNGYYFAKSRDSYFRYNVSLTTPDALVLTDTMRYNTGSRISYFYGPTNIYGTKGDKKDRDTLYTENGQYNTQTEQGAFGKNNLYHTGTRSLKGDSLFYDKLKGLGRAVMHITFEDKEQRTVIKGDLGTYEKADEHTIVTQDPYVVMVTEDSTKTDSVSKADSIKKADSVKKVSKTDQKVAINMNQLIKQTIPGKTDTVTAKQVAMLVKTAMPLADSLKKSAKIDPSVADAITQKLTGKVAASNSSPPKRLKTGPAKGKPKPGGKESLPVKPVVTDTTKKKVKTDTIYMSADTIETQIMAYKDLKVYLEKQRLAHLPDTGIYKKIKTKDSKFLVGHQQGVRLDTSYRQPDFFGKPKVVPVKKKVPSKQQLHRDSLEQKRLADSVSAAKAAEPADTARIRILIGYHDFKMFKSDLQAKSDSMFYTSSDSTIRCFVNPMMWTQGSQLSGDTIYMQMKHKKLDNMTMFPHAFIANIEKTDSLHFNQLGGKRMYGYFKDSKLKRIIFVGNAESIYFARDSGKMTISGIQRSLSSRITADFKDNKVTNMGFYSKPENRYGPEKKFTADDKLLKAFIWKPKDRPVSKESIIPSYAKKKANAEKKKAAAKAAADKGKNGKKPPGKPLPGKTAAKDSLTTSPGKLPGLKTAKDSTLKIDTAKITPPKPIIDTAKITRPKPIIDTTKVKTPINKPQPGKPVKEE
jgi:lipopolysaccharide export system protein LptA